VRGIALKPSAQPRQWDAFYSDPVTVKYGIGTSEIEIYFPPAPKTETLAVTVPGVKIKRYEPVRWQASDYAQHYYVYRQPTAAEIMCKWKNQNGETLYPYYPLNFVNNKSFFYPDLTPQQYESQILSKFLPVGETVYFPVPQEKDKSWYEQLWDGVVNFFKDLWKISKIIVNKVQKAYADLKTGVIKFVVDLCPIESLKDEFEIALTMLVDYGLMSLGIPPTLPNFDELTDMSVDYLASVALTEAGIPVNELSKEMIKDVGEGILNEVSKSANREDYNPINAPFLRLDSNYLYRPAYLDLELYNDADVPTVPGSLRVDITFTVTRQNRWDLHLVTESNYAAGSSAAISVASKYCEHFENGLNGYTVDYDYRGEEAVYDIFEPQILKVPRLMPKEKRTLRVYLTPYASPSYGAEAKPPSRYPAGHNLTCLDFENMYFYNGYAGNKFTNFNATILAPSPEECLWESGRFVMPDTVYSYTSPYLNSSRDQFSRAVNEGWVR
jgi:hypothetical protein